MNNVILAEPSTLALAGVAIMFLLILAALAIVTVPLIIYFLRRKQNQETKAPSTLSHTQVIPRKCPQCGAELKPDAPEGLCPACLLQRGIATEGGAPPGTPPFTPPPLTELAKLFPQLEILEPIGQGGMGAVYKARQPALDRLVALKILAPRSGGDVDFAERFTREARALAKLNHPNIVAVYDFGQTNAGQASSLSPSENLGKKSETGKVPALHYFIMEYVDGLNLRQVERAGKLQPQEALQIIPQICAALQFAHDEGVVHRDIKPENILLDKKGRVKIADFGLAKIVGLEAKDFRLTGARDVMGTPHYMAPEQIEKPQAVDHRADIYSLGVVFYEMLTGELPLGKFQPPSKKVQIDVRLDEVVLHALEKEPERRYQQVSEVKTQLDTIASTSAPGTVPAVSAEEILARDYTLNIRSCLRRGWNLVRNDFWPLVGMSAFVLAVLSAAPSSEAVFSNGQSSGTISILGILLSGPLMGGLYLYFLKKIRREPAGVETAFTGFRQPFPHLVIAGFLATLLTGLGFLCLILPGIYLFVAWILTFPLIIDRRLDFWPAMRLSRKIISKHWWIFLGFLIVLGLINLAGLLACFIGLLVTFPITFAALTYAYEDIIGAAKCPAVASPPVPLVAAARSPLRRGVLTGFIVFLAITVLAIGITLVLPRTYVGIALVRMIGPPAAQDPYQFQTESEVIQSQPVLGPVAASLNLGQRWGQKFNGGHDLSNEQTVALMKGMIEIQPVRSSRVIEIRFYSDSPKEAAEIANKIAETYCARPPEHTGEMIDRALPPWRPCRPDVPLNISIGVLAGLALGTLTGLITGLVSFWRRRKLPPPPVQKPDHFWRWFAVTVLVLISIPMVIAILGLLAAIAIPNFVKARQHSQQLAAQQWTQQGWQLWQAQKLDEAATKFQEAVKLAPKDADAWNGLGWAEFNSGKANEAEKAFQKAVSIETNQPGALNGLGQVYLSQGKYDQAETFLLKAAPRAPAAWYGLTRIYLLEGKFAEAEQWSQKLVDSGQANDLVHQMLKAAQEKHLSKGLQVMIEPASAANPAHATSVDSNFLPAMPAIQAWLELMDNGDYAGSWEAAADSFHDAVTKAEWVAKSKEIRQPLGNVLSRKLSTSEQTTTLSGMPTGSYFAAKFDTAFANFKPATETVTFALTDDGQWKAIAYLIQPRANEGKPVIAGADKAAVAAAKKWLTAIDDDRYTESWTDASDYFRGAITQDKWVSALETVRKPLGNLVSRDVKSAQLMTELPGAPDGQYVVMQFDSSFANKKTTIETVTFMQEKDGQWKCAGYFIK
jgi:serine/threonine protein kinase/tetratricopeptide (TPR) repeat protein